MGTSAFFSITNKNDHIPLYTRWDGFEEEILKQLKKLPEIHQKNIDLFSQNNNLSPFMQHWFDDYKKLVSTYQEKQDLDIQAKLFSMLSFQHFYITSIFNNKNELAYSIEDYDYTLSTISKKKVNTPAINLSIDSLNDYKILRVYQSDDIVDENTDLNSLQYIDFKYKDIDSEELIKQIHLLPFFFREFQCSIIPSLQENIDHQNNFVRLSYTISDFYNSNSNRIKNYVPFSNQEEEISILEDKLDYIVSLIPFDLYAPKFGIHLFLRFPMNVFPLTYSEAIFSNTKKPDAEIFMCGKRTNSIGSCINKQIIDDEANNNIQDFKTKYNSQSFIQTKFMTFKKDYTYSYYENNVAYILNELSSINFK